MIESQYTANVNKRLNKDLIRIWKIHDNFCGGIPDCFYRHLRSETGVPLWVEFKYLQRIPKRTYTKIVPQLSDLQKDWLREALAANENVLVIVGYESSGVIFQPDEWDLGIPCIDFKARLLDYKQVADIITQKLEDGSCANTENSVLSVAAL